MPESKRIFLAINISASKKFMDTIDELKRKLKHENIRWINPDNLHLTLRFFGETKIEQIPSIGKAVSKALESANKFTVEIQKFKLKA